MTKVSNMQATRLAGCNQQHSAQQHYHEVHYNQQYCCEIMITILGIQEAPAAQLCCIQSDRAPPCFLVCGGAAALVDVWPCAKAVAQQVCLTPSGLAGGDCLWLNPDGAKCCCLVLPVLSQHLVWVPHGSELPEETGCRCGLWAAAGLMWAVAGHKMGCSRPPTEVVL